MSKTKIHVGKKNKFQPIDEQETQDVVENQNEDFEEEYEYEEEQNQDNNFQNQLQELDIKYKRALADYQNLIRQTQKERSEYLKYANSELITQFLPLLDNLQMAQKHLDDQGLKMIIKQFQNILKEENIIEINPKEKDSFNEQLHEVIDTAETEDEALNGLIAETSLAGFKYQDGQILRHAKVKVYKLEESNNKS